MPDVNPEYGIGMLAFRLPSYVPIQESICLKIYHEAMKYQQSGEWRKAKELYCEILESAVMEEACQSSDDSVRVSTSTIGRLKFLIFKNIASISREQGDLSAAVDAYIEVGMKYLHYTFTSFIREG